MIEKENYFKNDELARQVWENKYQHNNETLDEFFERIASEFARLDNFVGFDASNDKKYEALSNYGADRLDCGDRKQWFLELFKDFKYIIPGGSVLAGVGSGKPVSLSNCFVLENGDSISQIFNAGRDMAQIYKRRGGVGQDLSLIRPARAVVNNAARTTGGVVPFMELFSQTTNTIGQDGRRGALMLSLDISHPDSPQFITSKQDLSKITGANISVKLNDEFMQAVENDGDYILRWPCNFDLGYLSKYDLDEKVEYNKLTSSKEFDPTFPDTVYVKKVKAKELWDSIIQCAWNTAEPGILFWDNILDNDPASVYPEFKAVSTNPCGEIPLSPMDSCRLIASNLYNLVDNKFTEMAEINENLAYKVFYEAQIIGDILVDLEMEYVQKIIDITTGDEKGLWEKIKEIGRKGRRTGVGLTGYADMCAALGVDYGNPEVTEAIMKLKMRAELDATIDLAIINGSFPSYDFNKEYRVIEDLEELNVSFESNVGNNSWYEFLQKEFPYQYKRMQQYGRRNVSFSTIAPTGTISMLAGTSSGCEPVFSLYYKRRKKCNPGEKADFTDQNGVGYTEHNVVHGSFKDWYITTEQEFGEDLNKLTIEGLDILYELSPWYNNTANDIDPEARIQAQSIMQKYTTHSISSTINLPADTPQETIALLYKLAWESSLKGVTVYRDGCRSGILVSHEEEKKPVITERPIELECKVLRFKNEKKNWIAFIGILDSNAHEIFTGLNDLDEFPIPSYVETGIISKIPTTEGSRYDFSYIDKYGYTNTLGGLNRVFDKEYWNYARFVSALLREKTKITTIIKIIEKLEFKNKSLNSWQSGIIRSLKSFIPNGEVAKDCCPECGGQVVYENGCSGCKDCGWSKCS